MAWIYHTVQLITGFASYGGAASPPYGQLVPSDTARDRLRLAALVQVSPMHRRPARGRLRRTLSSDHVGHPASAPTASRPSDSYETVRAQRPEAPHEGRFRFVPRCEKSLR